MAEDNRFPRPSLPGTQLERSLGQSRSLLVTADRTVGSRRPHPVLSPLPLLPHPWLERERDAVSQRKRLASPPPSPPLSLQLCHQSPRVHTCVCAHRLECAHVHVHWCVHVYVYVHNIMARLEARVHVCAPVCMCASTCLLRCVCACTQNTGQLQAREEPATLWAS